MIQLPPAFMIVSDAWRFFSLCIIITDLAPVAEITILYKLNEEIGEWLLVFFLHEVSLLFRYLIFFPLKWGE